MQIEDQKGEKKADFSEVEPGWAGLGISETADLPADHNTPSAAFSASVAKGIGPWSSTHMGISLTAPD